MWCAYVCVYMYCISTYQCNFPCISTNECNIPCTTTNQCDVAVVPGVVVHQGGPVGHSRYLVAVVPPRHHASVIRRVLTQPIVGLAEVIKDVPGAGGGGHSGTAMT